MPKNNNIRKNDEDNNFENFRKKNNNDIKDDENIKEIYENNDTLEKAQDINTNRNKIE